MTSESGGFLVVNADTAETAKDASESGMTSKPSHRWLWLMGLGFAVSVAAYVGFRLPSLYSMTLYNIEISDGAWRRGTFGTILGPLWDVTGYRYGVMALVALAILVLILAVAFVVSWTARWDVQRLLVIAWFLSPAGGYLFHEIGYLDQFVYVLFFLAAVTMTRAPFVLAMVIMASSVVIHEVTLFTTLPLIFLLALLRGTRARDFGLFAIPVLVGVILFLAPSMSEEQVGSTGARLQEVLPFEIRWDAVALFGRSLSETWAMEFYSPWRGFLTVLPLLLVSAVSVALVVLWLGRSITVAGSANRVLLAQLTAIGAVIVPFLLVFFGWDFYRWAFLGLANFVIVGFIWLGMMRWRPSVGVIGVLLVPLLVLFYVPLQYFDGYSPRSFTPEMFERIGYSPHTEFLGFPDDRL